MNNSRQFKQWQRWFKKEHGRAPDRNEKQEFREQEQYGWGKRGQIGGAEASDMQLTPKELAKRAVRGKGPPAIGAAIGGALGVGYSQGRRKR